MKIQGLLPIGSVVLLEGGEHRLMITGYAQRLQGETQVRDYAGCLWPEGYMKADQCYVFNNSDVNDVFFLGCQTEGQHVFIAKMEAMMEELRKKGEDA